MKKYFPVFLLATLLITCVIFYRLDEIYPQSFDLTKKEFNLPDADLEPALNKLSNRTRDFIRYECKSTVRIGGQPEFVAKNKQDKLWRIDGAWYACLDDHLSLEVNNCNVLSFGINHDYSFDQEIVDKYGCNTKSFDPFVETKRFELIRKSKPIYSNAYALPVTKKWTFYRMGIVGDEKAVKLRKKIGWMATLTDILAMTSLVNQTIDILKIDIEGGEASIIFNLDMDYACKYFKQFAFETHPPKLGKYPFQLLSKLEKCFSLFHRDTRFFKGDALILFIFLTLNH